MTTATNTRLTESDACSVESGNKYIQQFLTFVLNNDIYGISIPNIQEIIEYGAVTRVPMMPEVIAGVINLRGNVVPVIDLALRFSLPVSARTKRTSIIIVAVNHESQFTEVGVTVDEVNEVKDVLTDNIVPPPSFNTKIRTDFIYGMGKTEQQLLTLLDINTVLSIDELSEI